MNLNTHTQYRLRYQAGLVAPGEYYFVRWADQSRNLAVVRSAVHCTEHVLNAAHLA